MEEWLTELKENKVKENIQSEFGDLLFSFVNISRFLSIHPEEALIQTNQKFVRRFKYIEQKVEQSGKDFSEFHLEELDRFWEEAKKAGL